MQQKKSTKIKEMVKDKTATFDHYADGNLWYIVGDFEFPVPIEDTKGGIFKRDMKAISLMRWIRKHLEYIDDMKARFEIGRNKMMSGPNIQ